MLVYGHQNSPTTHPVDAIDNLRFILEKQIEDLNSEMVNGYETLEHSVRRATQQIDSIYRAMDRVEAIVAELQEEMQGPSIDYTFRTDINKCEKNLAHLFKDFEQLKEDHLRLEEEVARMQRSRQANVENIQQKVLHEEREIIFGIINPIFSALKESLDAMNKSKTGEINLLREIVEAQESRTIRNESRIEELVAEHRGFNIRDFHESMRDASRMILRTNHTNELQVGGPDEALLTEALLAPQNLDPTTFCVDKTRRERLYIYSHQVQAFEGKYCEVSSTLGHLLAQCIAYKISLIYILAAQSGLLLHIKTAQQYFREEIQPFRIIRVCGALGQIKVMLRKQLSPMLLEGFEAFVKTIGLSSRNGWLEKTRFILSHPNSSAKVSWAKNIGSPHMLAKDAQVYANRILLGILGCFNRQIVEKSRHLRLMNEVYLGSFIHALVAFHSRISPLMNVVFPPLLSTRMIGLTGYKVIPFYRRRFGEMSRGVASEILYYAKGYQFYLFALLVQFLLECLWSYSLEQMQTTWSYEELMLSSKARRRLRNINTH